MSIFDEAKSADAQPQEAQTTPEQTQQEEQPKESYRQGVITGKTLKFLLKVNLKLMSTSRTLRLNSHKCEKTSISKTMQPSCCNN
jgi:hypothetical protein